MATLKMVAKPDIKIDLKSDLFKLSTFKHGKQFKTHKQEQINGTCYIVDEWQWAIYPQKEGHYTLPVVVADLSIPVPAAGFRGMFFPDYEQKRIYSNRITLDIEPLPAAVQSAKIIGNQVEVTLHINPVVCKEREGVLCSIQVTSDADLEHFSVQEIEGLPSSIESFFSQQKSIEPTDTQQKNCKQFEFVLQPKQAGNFEIPGQSISYFDPQQRQKKTAKSDALMLTVMPKPHNDEMSIQTQKPGNAQAQAGGEHEADGQSQIDLHSYHVDKTVKLPWWLFFVIVSMTMPGIGAVFMKRRSWAKLQQPKQQAIMAIEHASKANNVCALYAILVRYLAAKNKMPEGAISKDYLEQHVAPLSLDQQQKDEWTQIIAQLVAITFDDAPVIERYDKNLFKRIILWIELLDRY